MDDYHNMTVNIVIPDYAAAFVDAFTHLAGEDEDATQVYIQNVYAILFAFKNDPRCNISLLKTALINTRKLNKTLQDMLHNMDRFFASLLEQKNYGDLLREHLDGYVEEIVRKKYHILKTSDNFYLYKTDIKQWLTQMRQGSVEEKEAPVDADALKAKVVDAAKEIAEAVDLEGADVIVTGGRGMGDAENFKLVEELAALLGGVVGASRPAIEEGWASRAHQVGQSGKIVAPKLYIACGVSGAMQHVSGIMGSKYIVAINKDEAASIFDIADVGIVGDVKEILPLLIEEIKARK